MASVSVRKAILLVAGFGTRFLPVTKSLPKEMLPIVDKPQIQYLVEEIVASGIKEIIFVTGRGKRAIEDHFDESFELEETLAEKGKHELLKEVRAISQLAKFAYVRQPRPRGHGEAILRAAHLFANEPVAVFFGDDIIDGPAPALKQLIPVYERFGDPVVALARLPKSEISKFGVVKVRPAGTGSRTYEILDFVEKPKPSDAPSSFAIIGKYILTPSFFDTLRKLQKTHQKELNVGDGIIEYIKKRPIYGYEVKGTWYDCGDKLGYLKANIAYARKRKELSKGLNAFLRKSK